MFLDRVELEKKVCTNLIAQYLLSAATYSQLHTQNCNSGDHTIQLWNLLSPWQIFILPCDFCYREVH